MSDIGSVLVAGSNSRLGATIVARLRERGVAVLATTRGKAALSPGEGLEVVAGIDLVKEEDLAKLVRAVNAWTSGSFHIVNCAGYFPGFAAIHELSASSARAVYESNLLAAYNLAAAIIPSMARQGGGQLVMFSTHALPPAFPFMAAFLSAKAGVEALCRTIANEYGCARIYATTLALATVDTPEERQLLPHRCPQDWLTPAEVARYVVDLLAAGSSMANGNVIQLFKYSDSYHLEAYLDRIGRRKDWPIRC